MDDDTAMEAPTSITATSDSQPQITSTSSSSSTTTTTTPTKKISLSRTFPSWKSTHPTKSWCIPQGTTSNSGPEGLLYVKTYKAGSSTVAGVTARIARRHSQCSFQWKHRPAHTYARRSRDTSFLFGSVRHPTDRAVSHVFYEFSLRNQIKAPPPVEERGGLFVDGVDVTAPPPPTPPSDEEVIERLKHWTEPLPLRWSREEKGKWETGAKWASFQLAYNSLRPPSGLYLRGAALTDRTQAVMEWEQTLVSDILHDFDFLIVSERMAESLVVLSLILDVSLGDILSLKSKVAGEQYAEDMNARSCHFISPPVLSEGVEAYLRSDEWIGRVSGDLLFHTVANRALDETIAALGQERFEEALERYWEVSKLAEQECGPTAVFPCDRDGNFHPEYNEDCEMGDKGCGMACLDRLAERWL